MSEIKSCPFCGSKARVWMKEWYGEIEYVVHCTNMLCVACNTHYLTDKEAIEAWNRRVGE